MPVSPAYQPDPQFTTLGPEFADPVRAAEFPVAILRYRNDRAALTVGLDGLTDDEWVGHFGRFRPLPGGIDPPLAQRYHGHQFRVYNPDLGDGRGFLFAQLREAGTGRLLDLGTKGSGQTPWSRSGDGRLTLKGGVREVLATAMLEALGVPTSRSFSLVETGEALERGDEPSPTRSSVLVRLSHSHVRFGTFQRHAFFEAEDRVRALVDHVVATYYPELQGANDRPSALLAAVAAKAARLTASWMAAGFVHGVLNTDNMNITGESFDYGPYRFLPKSDPNFTAAYFDQSGLYSFGRQPEAVFWNLQQLAGCLSLLTESDPLVEALNGFGPAYRRELMAAMLGRLGVAPRGDEEDAALVQSAFGAMAEGGKPALGAVLLRLVRPKRRPRPGRPARRALRVARLRGLSPAPRGLRGRPPGAAGPPVLRQGRTGGTAHRRDRGDLGRHRPARRLGRLPRQARKDRDGEGGLGTQPALFLDAH